LGFAMRLLLLVVSTLAVVLYLNERQESARRVDRQAQLNGGVEALQLLAEEGDVEAMNRLGMDAWDKYGADSKEAVKWLCMARDGGYWDSGMLLGMTPCPVDGAPEGGNVVKWYKDVADQGNAKAHYHLAGRYFLGQGVEVDKVAAYIHAKHAADLGFYPAERRIYNREWLWEDDDIVRGELLSLDQGLLPKPLI
jgi:TPR repeat protein